METESPNWSDIYTAEQLAAAVDLHALKLAKQKGWYEIAQDLRHAAECIRDLSTAGSSLVRNVLAAKESLTRLP